MWAGLSQCATRKRSGRSTASARCLGAIVELVEAMIAPAPTRVERRPSTSRLRSSSSGSASCTKAHASRPSSPVRSSIRSSADATSPPAITPSSVMSRRSRVISRRASAKTARRSSGVRALTSTRRTRRPPKAKASAIWRPILPGPRTATVFIDSPRRRLRLVRPRSRRFAPVNHHDVLAHPAVVVREPDRRAGHLAGAGLVAELDEDLRRLGDAGGAERVTASDQPAARVHDHVAAVVAAPRSDERARLALAAEAELLARNELRDREAVVYLGEVDLARRDAGHPVRGLRRTPERGPLGVVLVERGELEAVQRLARPSDPDRLVGQPARPLLAREDHRRGAVGDRRAHEQAQGRRDHVLADHRRRRDRKSTRLNSSHPSISYAVFCLKKKKTEQLQAKAHL